MNRKIRWGILAPGRIAHKFVQDLLLVPNAEAYAVGSRNLDRAQEFATAYGIPHAYGSYGELIQSDVDVIYIANPHAYHCESTLQVLQGGKPVLCEKPMGVNSKQTHQMIQAAQENKVFLMEALWSRFNPAIQRVYQHIQEGTIGDLRYLHADFAFYALDRDEDGRLLNPNLAGGSLLDIGIYPLFLSYLLLGMPSSIQAKSHFHKTGVEVQTSMLLDYPEAQAVLYSGLTSRSAMEAEISGTKGSLFLHPRWHEAQGYSLEQDGERKEVAMPTHGLGYTHEIQEVHHCLGAGKLQSELWSHQNSLDLVRLMDQVREQTGIRFPFED